MKELNKKEMLEVVGGQSITASMVSAIYKGFQTVFEIGEALGSYIRRAVAKKMCDI